MTLRDIAVKTQKLALDNSPAILTAVGVTGTLTTAYLAGKASFKAAKVLADIEYTENLKKVTGEPRVELNTKDKAKIVWKLYIPTLASSAITCTAIISGTRIGTRRAAALATAYSLSERAFAEYKDKVIETVGKNKEQKVRDDIAQDRVARNPVENQQVVITGGGDVLCYDMYTGRYFESDMETLKKAQNDVNYMILNNFYASLNDFYDKIGLSRVPIGDDMGWNSDKQLELEFSTTMSDDNRPCIAVGFRVDPIRGFHRVH